MTIYCRDDIREMYYVAANLIASQLITKPDSVLGASGTFNDDETITDLLMDWVVHDYVDFDRATLVEYKSSASADTKVDLLIYGIGDGYSVPKNYNIYKAFVNAKRILAIATGKGNEKVLRDALEIDVLAENPVIAIREHPDVCIVGDSLALGLLTKEKYRWI